MSGANVENCIEGVVGPSFSRGLVIRTPYVDQILDGLKTWEMRSRPTKIRGRIALIKAGSGLIVGEADLVDSQGPLESEAEIAATWMFHRVPRKDRHLLKKWRYPWILVNVEKYHKPICYDHPQGAVTWVDLS